MKRFLYVKMFHLNYLPLSAQQIFRLLSSYPNVVSLVGNLHNTYYTPGIGLHRTN